MSAHYGDHYEDDGHGEEHPNHDGEVCHGENRAGEAVRNPQVHHTGPRFFMYHERHPPFSD